VSRFRRLPTLAAYPLRLPSQSKLNWPQYPPLTSTCQCLPGVQTLPAPAAYLPIGPQPISLATTWTALASNWTEGLYLGPWLRIPPGAPRFSLHSPIVNPSFWDLPQAPQSPQSHQKSPRGFATHVVRPLRWRQNTNRSVTEYIILGSENTSVMWQGYERASPEVAKGRRWNNGR